VDADCNEQHVNAACSHAVFKISFS